jgi:hypothetical protein
MRARSRIHAICKLRKFHNGALNDVRYPSTPECPRRLNDRHLTEVFSLVILNEAQVQNGPEALGE